MTPEQTLWMQKALAKALQGMRIIVEGTGHGEVLIKIHQGNQIDVMTTTKDKLTLDKSIKQ